METCVRVPLWGRFEQTFDAVLAGNPFLDVSLHVVFRHGDSGLSVEVEGFYDGDACWRIRFMPDAVGTWTWRTRSNQPQLDGHAGMLCCTPADADAHGPVRVQDRLHFAHADGTPFFPFGTTSYGWAHQPDPLAERTLESLRAGPFNKIRFCVLPHHSRQSAANMPCFPFVGDPEHGWDFERFDPAWFRLMERRIDALAAIGVEADLILFHPYCGPWPFRRMPHETDLRYVRYLVARFASFRNVWWSLANEYDFIPEKTVEDWDDLCRETAAADPYGHLLSIHNGTVLYAQWQPWITHACVQDGLALQLPGRAVVLRNAYHKPVIYDEFCYEGNFNVRWGNLSGEETTFRFWEALMGGTYAGHGEVVATQPGVGESEELAWTAVGGTLRGTSPERIDFLRRLVEAGAKGGWEPVDKWWQVDMARQGNERFLFWFGKESPTSWTPAIPEKELALVPKGRYRAEVIDAWNMTIEPVEGVLTFAKRQTGDYFFTETTGRTIGLPGRPMMAIRLTAETE